MWSWETSENRVPTSFGISPYKKNYWRYRLFIGDHTSRYFRVQLETLMLKFPLEIIGREEEGPCIYRQQIRVLASLERPKLVFTQKIKFLASLELPLKFSWVVVVKGDFRVLPWSKTEAALLVVGEQKTLKDYFKFYLYLFII